MTTKICVMCQNRRDKPPQLRICAKCGVEKCDHRRCDCPQTAAERPRPLKSGSEIPVRPVVVTCPCGSRLDAIKTHGTVSVHVERTCAGCGATWSLQLTLVGFTGRGKLATYKVADAKPKG